MRLLLVEDDHDLRALLAQRLRRDGFAVDEADGLVAAEAAQLVHSYDCVVLDRVLPDGDGLDRLVEWRAEGADVPVVVLTARRAPGDPVAGFDAGADDYLTKPFAVGELVARVRAVTRRQPPRPRPRPDRWGDLELDRASRAVRRRGVVLALAPKEFALLQLLLDAQGRVVSRRTLVERVWDENADLMSNAVNVHVASLRRKLGDPPLIRTVRGAGYALVDPER